MVPVLQGNPAPMEYGTWKNIYRLASRSLIRFWRRPSFVVLKWTWRKLQMSDFDIDQSLLPEAFLKDRFGILVPEIELYSMWLMLCPLSYHLSLSIMVFLLRYLLPWLIFHACIKLHHRFCSFCWVCPGLPWVYFYCGVLFL